MDIKEIKSEILQERYFEINHPSGLKIFVMPKENYSSTYAIFGTNYGSIDTRFKRSDCDEWTEVPEGIAHFLEHKLFESEELGAFERYAKTGASANAYTSFDKTCYLFQCSDNFKESLKILLDFVQNPYFTAQTVEKEQGIIAQEIRMYLDEAGWMSMFNLLKCFYHKHPVKIDIAGTVESIAQITDKLLYSCYNTFYNLHNMALAVVGNASVEEVLEVCNEYLKQSEELSIEKSFEDEPREIVQSYIEHNLEVSVPVFSFGYKEACEKPIPDFRDYIETNILLEVIAGKTSPLYTELFEKGLINNTFSKEYFTGYGYESVIFEGESERPEEVAKAIKEEIARIKNEGIDAELFESVRRSLYGKEIMSFNDIDNIANSMIACEFNNWNMFDAVNIYRDITASDIEKRLSSMMDEQFSALSVVRKAN
ncbi:MAG: insulinase family protein [Ruminococcaceae bacterium]|nr:insulinase family protein [Oscillospiraceae bacterium]